MKQYRTPLHRKPKPWRFRKARRNAIRSAARSKETRYRREKRLKARAHRQWCAEEMRGRPKMKSLRDRWEDAYIRDVERQRRAAIRRLERQAVKEEAARQSS